MYVNDICIACSSGLDSYALNQIVLGMTRLLYTDYDIAEVSCVIKKLTIPNLIVFAFVFDGWLSRVISGLFSF